MQRALDGLGDGARELGVASSSLFQSAAVQPPFGLGGWHIVHRVLPLRGRRQKEISSVRAASTVTVGNPSTCLCGSAGKGGDASIRPPSVPRSVPADISFALPCSIQAQIRAPNYSKTASREYTKVRAWTREREGGRQASTSDFLWTWLFSYYSSIPKPFSVIHLEILLSLSSRRLSRFNSPNPTRKHRLLS